METVLQWCFWQLAQHMALSRCWPHEYVQSYQRSCPTGQLLHEQSAELSFLGGAKVPAVAFKPKVFGPQSHAPKSLAMLPPCLICQS